MLYLVTYNAMKPSHRSHPYSRGGQRWTYRRFKEEWSDEADRANLTWPEPSPQPPPPPQALLGYPHPLDLQANYNYNYNQVSNYNYMQMTSPPPSQQQSQQGTSLGHEYGFNPNPSFYPPSKPPSSLGASSSSMNINGSSNSPLLPSTSSAEALFSDSETTDLMGFLNNFNSDLDPSLVNHDGDIGLFSNSIMGGPSPPLPPPPPIDPSLGPGLQMKMDTSKEFNSYPNPSRSSSRSKQSLPPNHTTPPSAAPPASASSASTGSQKRLAHILSEQKRRNTIRTAYSTLISLLSPGPHLQGTISMPTRGRPKGSGSAGSRSATERERGSAANTTRGKSGILFRAVEYVNWLEEGNEALRAECERVESVVGGQGYGVEGEGDERMNHVGGPMS